MGLIDWLTESGLEPETDRLVTGVLRRYGQAQIVGRLGDNLIDRLSGKASYDEENQRLDIALKRRALGLQDSDDYEDAVNSEAPLIAAGLGGALQKIPEPGFLSPKGYSRGKTLLSTSIATGEKYVSPGIVGRLVRALR